MSNHKITYSTELMQNYLQAEIVQPEANLQALQTSAGNALLFSIGTDNSFYVTAEVPGVRHGWERSNLSTVQVAKDFGGATGATCKDFSVAQCTDESIHLAMVLSDSQNDHLYLSLGNSAADTSWVTKPAWVAYPYDDPKHGRSQVQIAGVFLSEASDGEYIVVDVIRDPASAQALIFRYYIDVNKGGGYAWHAHDVAIDIEVHKYASCLGRKGGQGSYPVDGIYTSGQVDGSAQLVYAPLYNVFNLKVAPSPDLLHLPGNLAPDAIAACRNSDNSSDLYATSAGNLYYFSSTNQENDATAELVSQNALFNSVRSLFAFATGNNSVMVWGLNANDQIFYTTCPLDQLTATPSAWSFPLPILAGVEQVSPYVNRAYSANSFFAHTGQNKLTKAVKSPETTMWSFRDITLPPPDTTTPAQKFSSYTTRVQVNDANDQPAANVSVSISASNVTSVYINHLYYVISATPIQVNTDVLGSITIVESVHTLAGTQLTIGIDDATVTINPMDKAFQKAASLTTKDQVKSATIKYPDGSTKPLVAPGTSDDILNQVATGNQQLSKAYSALTPATSVPVASAAPRAMGLAMAMPMPAPLSDIDSVLVDVGDLFSWLGHEIESGVEHFIQLLEDAATGVLTFIATIAGQVYHAVLDVVEKVVAAVQWIYNAVKTAIEDLIKFLEFLFELADMKRTKEVIKNLTKLYLNHHADQIEVIKGEFDSIMTEAENAINKWAGLGDWSGLGSDASSPINSKSTPSANQSAPGSLLGHHYQGNANNTTQITPAPAPDPSPNPIEVLIQAISKEADTIGETISKLQKLAENFASMSLEDALKQLVGIIADLVLESAKNVIDALFDILYDVAKAAVAMLDTPIHIPVLSDILSDFGVPEFSFLDIACWVAAIPTTLVYKVVHNQAPFPDDEETTFLINTTDYQAVLNAFRPQTIAAAAPAPTITAARAPQMMAMAAMPMEDSGPTPAAGLISLSPAASRAIFVTGHCVSGFCSLTSAIVSSFEAAEETGENDWAIPSAVLGILGGVSGGLANALVPYDPVEDTAVSAVGMTTTVIRILCKILFSGPAQKKFAGASSVKINWLAVEDGRGVGGIVDAVLVIPGLVVSICHFDELSKKPVGATRSIAIVDEVSNLTSHIARISYAVAVNTEAEVKLAAIGVMAVSNVCNGGLQIADSVIS